MWYIHVVTSVVTTFTVYWHDIHQHMKGTSDNDNAWKKAYTDLVQYGDLISNPCRSPQLYLLGMLRNAEKYARTCVTDEISDNETLGANTVSGILSAPCGKIHIQGAIKTPVVYTWAIVVWKNFKINTSVATINVPYSDKKCSVNYLRLYERNQEGIARLCGYATRKIFYSKTSSVNIKLSLEYVKLDAKKILSMAYQVLSKFSLYTIILHPKVKPDNADEIRYNYNAQHLYVRTNKQEMNIYYYNTFIWNQLKAVIQSTNCSTSRVLVYDGPSSKSKLLGESQDQDTFISSLYILSIYIIQQPSMSSTCYNVNITLIDHPIQRQWVNVNSTERIRYEAGNINTLIIINVQVPPNKFINIKMTRFEYTGNTEAGCYLGGIVIHDDGKPQFSPLCGEYGRLIFEDYRLDGLTLGSNRTDIYVFLFSGENNSLILDMIISADDCEGIQNPKELYINQRYTGKNIEYVYTWEGIKYGRLRLQLNSSVTCVKIQNFFDTIAPKSCYVTASDLHGDLSHYYEARLMVAAKMPLDSAFWVTKPYSILIHKYNFGRDDISVPKSPTNDTIVNESYISNFFSFKVNHDIHWATKYDGITEIKLQFAKQQECSKEDVSAIDSLTFKHSLGRKCSSLSVTLSNAVFDMQIPWPGQQKQLTIDILRHPKKFCFDGDLFIVIKLITNERDSPINFDIALLWTSNITHRAINSEIHLHTPTSRQCSKRCLLV